MAMGIKALGYVVIATAKQAEWHRFMTGVVGAMHAGHAADGAALYRIDDRPFRFRIEAGVSERLLAAAYDVGDAAALSALQAQIEALGRPVESGTPDEAAMRGVAAFFRTSDPAGNGLEFFHGDSRDTVEFVSPVGVSGFVTGEMGMGHTVFAAPNFDETYAFYKAIGFRDNRRAALSLQRRSRRSRHGLWPSCMRRTEGIIPSRSDRCRHRLRAVSI